MDWIERATLRGAPLVSVVLPTRDRRDLLPRAIDSVQKQSYGNWELLIVDDGSVDSTAEFLAGLAGERLRCFRHHGAGACAARNVALAQARGDLIAYLDDDNMMHPGWLKAVVWGFEQRPEANVLYGAYVVDDAGRIFRKKSGDLPRLFFLPYDHYQVARRSIADIGCIAHRAGLPEARFDESLREMGDWDLFLRLTRTAPPLALPAIACFYTTSRPSVPRTVDNALPPPPLPLRRIRRPILRSDVVQPDGAIASRAAADTSCARRHGSASGSTDAETATRPIGR